MKNIYQKSSDRLNALNNAMTEIQKFALPIETKFDIATLSIDSIVVSSDISGGDFYDIFEATDDVVFWIGDVAGHGVMASIIMLMIQSFFNSCFKACDLMHPGVTADLKLMYDSLNMIYYDEVIRKLGNPHPSTLLLCKYSNNVLRVIGQHEYILLKRNGSVTPIDTKQFGVPFGLERDISPHTHEYAITLCSGDDLLFYTDGITEALNNDHEEFGLDRLVDSFTKSQTINTIMGDVNRWQSREKQLDDTTLLHIRVL
jgi:sigma-B regulation protein RsbU (phosphoserine phosphatase)